VPAAESGWLDLRNYGEGWSRESVIVWELQGPEAIRWEIKPDRKLVTGVVPRDKVAWVLEVVQELDQVRTVPRHPRYYQSHRRSISFGDLSREKVRVFIPAPERTATVFSYQLPMEWERMGGPYSRKHASIYATMVTRAFLKPPRGEGKEESLREVGLAWLNPEQIGRIPPGLLQVLLKAVKEGSWKEYRPALLDLKKGLDHEVAEERKRAELAKVRSTRFESKDYEVASRRINLLERELRAIDVERTGDLSYELWKLVKDALDGLHKSP
jgi:hypothetical protein